MGRVNSPERTKAMAENADFEQPIQELKERIAQLRAYPGDDKAARELEKLERKLADLQEQVFASLSPWQTTLVARHPDRPYTNDYIRLLCTDFMEVHGDRRFADDQAIVTGFGTFEGRSVAVIGHQKGKNTKMRIERNFGMPRPEGYRKALRVMQLAARFGKPIFTFIDTPGAYPGIGAEERGQAEAIAVNLREMATLPVPIIVTVTGEGGSGGALAIGVGDRILMLQHSIYSVISPEGCAAILWKNQDPPSIQAAAKALKLTAPDLLRLGLIDEVLPEPAGGAHSDEAAMAETLRQRLRAHLDQLDRIDPEALVRARYEKFREMGEYQELH